MSTYRVPRTRAHLTHRALRDDLLRELEPLLFEPLSLTRAEEARRPFEEGFARAMDQRHAVGVHSGTAGLLVALRAVGVGPGDEVITVANSDISTTAVISHCGAQPVVADVLVSDYTLDPDLVEARITRRTKALLPVDIHGHPANVRRLREIADRHGLKIVEDACLAAGATDYGAPVGAFADATVHSFAAYKPLGSVGNGGMVTTNDDAVAERARLLSKYGYAPQVEGRKGELQLYVMEGYNVPLDPIQAVLLRLKLPYLAEWTARRRAIVQMYVDGLRGSEVIVPTFRPESQPTFRSFTIRVRDGAQTLRDLREAGVEAVRHYTPPIHHNQVYAGGLPGSDNVPVTEMLATQIVSLPVAPELDDDDIHYAIDALRHVLA